MSEETEVEHEGEYYCGHCSAWVPISSGLHPHTGAAESVESQVQV